MQDACHQYDKTAYLDMNGGSLISSGTDQSCLSKIGDDIKPEDEQFDGVTKTMTRFICSRF